MNFSTLILAAMVSASAVHGQSLPFLPDSLLHKHFEVTEASRNPFMPEFGNEMALLNQGDIALKWRIYLIRNARTSIDVQTFIWSNDECGTLVLDELVGAAKRGVKVRLLIDHIASDKEPEILAHYVTQSPNMEIKYYRPVGKRLRPHLAVKYINMLFFLGNVNQRMHNKLFIVDGVVAITGGRNYKNHYYNRSTNLNFKDRDLVILGHAVKRALRSFEEYWKYRLSVSASEFFDINQSINGATSKPPTKPIIEYSAYFPNLDRDLANKDWIQSHIVDALSPVKRVRHISDDPGKNRRKLAMNLWAGGKTTAILRELIEGTEQELIIQSPYVVVNRKSQRMFKKIIEKSPQPKIIVSTNSFAAADHIITYAANYRLRAKYIQQLRFNIFEFKPNPAYLDAMLPQYGQLVERVKKEGKKDMPYLSIHGKTFVIDDRYSFVGTYNLDPRSENLNTENGFLIDDPIATAKIKADIFRDIAPENSWVIARKEIPLAEVNDIFQGISSLSPIDIWPIRNTSSFELIPGQDPVPADHAEFYLRYQDIGEFPGAENLSPNEIMTLIYKTFGKFLTPAL